MGVEKKQHATVRTSASEERFLSQPSSEELGSDELIPMSELAKRAGVPLSTANKYVRRHPDKFHPVESARGSRFPFSDLSVLKGLYEKSPRRNQKPPERPKSRKQDKASGTTESRGVTLPVEKLSHRKAKTGMGLHAEPQTGGQTESQTERLPESQTERPLEPQTEQLLEPQTERLLESSLQTAEPNVREPQHDVQETLLSPQHTNLPVEVKADEEHIDERSTQVLVQAITAAVTAALAGDVERLLQTERQISTVLGNIDQRYRFMFDQFDQLNRIIARSWETQQMFAETINQTLERFKQHDKIIDMLMEHSKKLEKENSRLMELFSAAQEAAAALQPPERHRSVSPDANTASTRSEPSPDTKQSRGFLRRRRRRR